VTATELRGQIELPDSWTFYDNEVAEILTTAWTAQLELDKEEKRMKQERMENEQIENKRRENEQNAREEAMKHEYEKIKLEEIERKKQEYGDIPWVPKLLMWVVVIIALYWYYEM
jgi:hypothetical protein